MGRPPVGPRHPIRMPAADWKYVERLAAELGISRSTAVGVIVREHAAGHAEPADGVRPS